MVTITLDYLGELRCHATHGPSGTVIQTDAPVDNHGKGEAFSPTDLVATGLGSCILTVMGIVADRHGLDLRGTRVTVTKEMVTVPQRRIGRLATEIHVPCQLDDADRQRLENAARTCPVHRSLHPDIDAPVTFRWGA